MAEVNLSHLEHKKDPPWMVFDTGTLLTLLLSDEDVERNGSNVLATLFDNQAIRDFMKSSDYKPNENGFANLNLILDLARHNVIRVAIPDMVLSEFMGVYGPVSAEYSRLILEPQYADKSGAFEHIPNGFPKRAERTAFLRTLYAIESENPGSFQVVDTKIADQYMDRVAHHLDDRLFKGDTPQRIKDGRKQVIARKDKGAMREKFLNTVEAELKENKKSLWSFKHAKWPFDGDSSELSHEETDIIERALLQNGNPIAQEIKRSKLRADRGEISIADAIIQLQKQEQEPDIFVAYEGTDVRGRVIQRYQEYYDDLPKSEGGREEDNEQYFGLPKPRYNPKNTSRFKVETVQGGHTGDRDYQPMTGVHFVSTRGFLNAFQSAADAAKQFFFSSSELVRTGGNRGKRPGSGDLKYYNETILSNVCEYGLPRMYNKLRDQTATEISPGKNLIDQHMNQDKPWLEYIAGKKPHGKSSPFAEEAKQADREEVFKIIKETRERVFAERKDAVKLHLRRAAKLHADVLLDSDHFENHEGPQTKIEQAQATFDGHIKSAEEHIEHDVSARTFS
ncbi:MAG: hypothetical protein MRY32_09360 [Rickettsiales bacterium]|nr:hypothetical protein [Rickettsiales bacterium]